MTPCFFCNQPAATHCPRCGQPVCHAHSPLDSAHRCTACERVYADSRALYVLEGSAGVAMIGLLVLAWALGRFLDSAGYLAARGGDLAWAQFSVYFALSIGAVTLGLGLRSGLHSLRRRRFLARRAMSTLPSDDIC